MPSSEETGDEGMVSVEIALGTFSIVVMIALVISVFAAAMTTQTLCSAVALGVRENARGGNGLEAAQAVTTGLNDAHFEFHRDERWVYGSAESAYRGPAGLIGLRAHCRYQGLRESTLVDGETR